MKDKTNIACSRHKPKYFCFPRILHHICVECHSLECNGRISQKEILGFLHKTPYSVLRKKHCQVLPIILTQF